MANKNRVDGEWICPVCGFEAAGENEKTEHLEKTKNDSAHSQVSVENEEEEDEV